MLTIWGRANSINVQKVLWAAEELGLAFTRHDVGGVYGGLDTAQYKAMNPNSLVPTLQDGDLTLWESNAIVRYLAAKHGAGTLWPSDPGQRALADRWMDWQASVMQPSMREVFWGLIRTPPEKRDAAKIEASRIETEKAFRLLDAHLAASPYLGGKDFTMGDIPVGAYCRRWYGLPIERPRLAFVEAWYQRLGERPGYRQHVMIPVT